MIQSARIQSVMVGDDATLTHQLVTRAVVGNSIGLQPVLIAAGDSVKCFYCSADGSSELQASATPGSLPSSSLTVTLTALQSAGLKPGLGQTVRVEITRASGKKESLYLYNEYDVVARGLPSAPAYGNLEV